MDSVNKKNIEAFGQIGSKFGGLDKRLTEIESIRNRYSPKGRNTTWLRDKCSDNLRIIVKNHFDTAKSMIMTPSPWDSTPVKNLLIPDKSLIVETKSRSEHVLVVNFDNPKMFDSFACPYHSMSVNGTIRIEIFEDENLSGMLKYDSGEFFAKQRKKLSEIRPWIDPWRATYGDDLKHSASHWFHPVKGRSARITFFDKPTGTLPDFFYLSLLYFGYSWTPDTHNFDWGMLIEFNDFVTHERSEGKTLVSTGTRDAVRQLSFNLSGLTERDVNLFFEFVGSTGQIKEFFISAYPNYSNKYREVEHGFVARFMMYPARSHLDNNTYESTIILGEI